MFKVGDLVRFKEGFEATYGLSEENIYCVGEVSGMGSLSLVGKAGWISEKYFELFSQPTNEPRFKSISVETKAEQVHSPKHYNVLEDIEAIQIIAGSMSQEMFKGYCLGNILKYRLRCGAKDDVNQELAKADKYKELFAKYKHLCKEGK